MNAGTFVIRARRLHVAESRNVDFGDVFIAGEHKALLWMASAADEAVGAGRSDVEVYLDPVLAGVWDDGYLFDWVGPAEVQAIRQLTIVLAKPPHNGAFIGIDAHCECEIANRQSHGQKDEGDSDEPYPAWHHLTQPSLNPPEAFFEEWGRTAAGWAFSPGTALSAAILIPGHTSIPS